MAYMSQDHKKELAPKIMELCRNFGVKGSLSVRHHSTLVLKLSKGKIDFGQNDARVNVYWIKDHFADKPLAKEFLLKVKDAMYGPRYYDNSEPMTDFFDCSHYIEINIGGNKPYVYTID